MGANLKRLLAAVFLLFSVLPALADYIYPSQIAPTWGYIRKAPCGVGAGDSCGDNPTTYHLTPDWCGTQVSTGAARNSDGVTFSTKGNRYTLPTLAEFTAAGRANAAGASGSSGTANREAQCQITFVMGAPGPSNYLRIGIDSTDATDKFTAFAQGAFDFNQGDIVFPYLTPGTITFWFDGVSWKAGGGSPALLEKIDMGQQSTNGNGRLFPVTADPSWWTAGTLVGKLAWCPVNGRGLVGNSNGGFQLTHMPINCVFKDNNTASATATEWIVMRNIVSGVVSSIQQGAAYGAGTAPNGEAYAAGNYVVLPTASAINASSGDTVRFYNLKTTSGVDYNGKWIVKFLASGDPGCTTAPCMELHEKVDDNGNSGGAGAGAVPVGPPSAYQAADSLIATGINVHFHYQSLGTANMATARKTNPTNGVEMEGSASRDTILGIARRTIGIGYQDTTTNRHVASLYNPIEKKCQGVTASDRTVTSTTFVEVNSDIRCNFVYLAGSSAQAIGLGDTGRRVRYAATIGAANGTAADGCEFAIGFDGTTAEPEVGGFTNPAATVAGRQSVSINGAKVGLTETAQGNHYITLLARAVTGGTCTINAATTNVTAYVWQ